MNGKKITKETMERVWALWQKKVDAETIASVLGTGITSVYRIIKIMTHTMNGEFDICDKYCGGNYQSQRLYAREILGITRVENNVVESKEKEARSVSVDENGATYLLEVLQLLREQNAIMKRCLLELGVNYETI